MNSLVRCLGLLAIFSSSLSCASSDAVDAQLTSSMNCRIDLNQDGVNDVAIFLQNLDKQGGKLIVLLSNDNSYDAVELMSLDFPSNLYCKYGREITETNTGNLPGGKYRTEGTYLLLEQLESSAFVFFWKKEKLTAVQISG